MASDPSGKSDIPESIRDLMKSSIEQAKQAFDTFVTSSEKAWESVESSSQAAAGNMKSLNDKIAEITRENADANFNLALKLAEAKDMPKALELQNNHARKQMETFSKQLEEIRDLTTDIIKESTAHMTDDTGAEAEPGEEEEESGDEEAEDGDEAQASSSFRRW
jgi:phasin